MAEGKNLVGVDVGASSIKVVQLKGARKGVSVAKYGFATKITKQIQTLVGTLRGKRTPYGDRGVVVTPHP